MPDRQSYGALVIGAGLSGLYQLYRLREAGVPVQHRRFPGQMHGFFTMLNILPGSADAIAYLADELGPRLAAG